jgi:hypothetical protein
MAYDRRQIVNTMLTQAYTLVESKRPTLANLDLKSSKTGHEVGKADEGAGNVGNIQSPRQNAEMTKTPAASNQGDVIDLAGKRGADDRVAHAKGTQGRNAQKPPFDRVAQPHAARHQGPGNE